MSHDADMIWMILLMGGAGLAVVAGIVALAMLLLGPRRNPKQDDISGQAEALDRLAGTMDRMEARLGSLETSVKNTGSDTQ